MRWDGNARRGNDGRAGPMVPLRGGVDMASILLIDSTALFREPMALALRSHGFDVIEAGHGRQAVTILQSRPIDLIVLELILPVMDGLSLLRYLRGEPRYARLPVVVLSAAGSRAMVLKAAQFGVRDYLVKSHVTLHALVERIHRALSAATDSRAALPAGSCATAAQSCQASPGGTTDAASTVPAPRPDAAAALKSMKSIVTKSEVLDRIQKRAELRAFSPTVTKLMQLTGSERATLEQITRTIRQDQALAVRILQMANSAAFNRGDPVESIEKAAQRLGMAQIRQAAINVGVVSEMSEIGIGGRVDAAQFWEHSIATGLIAAKIARSRAPEDADQAFTMGLMHDVGRVLFAEDFPDEYAEAMRVTDELGLPLELVEARLFMASHAECMDRLLHLWRFPKDLIDPIVFHHLSLDNIRRMAPRRVKEVATLALADRMAHALLLGSSGNDVLYPTEELCEVLGVDDRVFGRLEDETRRETDGLKLSMLAAGGGGGGAARGWVDPREAVRQSLAAPARPLYISRRPGIDAFRCFFDLLRQDEAEAPNLLVLHVTDAREVEEVAAMTRCVECSADASGLPALVISSAIEELDLRGRLDGRRVEVRRAPIAVSHLLHAMNELLASESGKAAA